MELKLTFEDLRSNALYVPCSLTKFEHFNHLAQAAIMAAGKGTYTTEDSYNVIYAPPKEVMVEAPTPAPTPERPKLSENPAWPELPGFPENFFEVEGKSSADGFHEFIKWYFWDVRNSSGKVIFFPIFAIVFPFSVIVDWCFILADIIMTKTRK